MTRSKNEIISDTTIRIAEISRRLVTDKEIATSDLILIVTELIPWIQHIKGISGPDKKEIILICMSKYVSENVQEESLRNALEIFIKESLPVIIDSLVVMGKDAHTFIKNNCCKIV